MLLSELAMASGLRYEGEDRDIASIEYDSRKVKQGSMFCCIVGALFDGHTFAQSAVDNGADIINMSLGNYYYNSTLNAAIQSAISHNVSVIAAMGNDGSNSLCYPAAYNNVIAVAAVNSAGVSLPSELVKVRSPNWL